MMLDLDVAVVDQPRLLLRLRVATTGELSHGRLRRRRIGLGPGRRLPKAAGLPPSLGRDKESVPQRAFLVRHTALKIRVVVITNQSPI
jgi:hypothetical protein